MLWFCAVLLQAAVLAARQTPSPEPEGDWGVSDVLESHQEHDQGQGILLLPPPPPDSPADEDVSFGSSDILIPEYETELDGTCDCWNTTEDGRNIEVECRCGGLQLLNIPSDLPNDVYRITVVHAGLRELQEGALQPYQNSLKEIILNNVKILEAIHNKAFHNLHSLRTVYINHAPQLRYIGNHVFNLQLPALRSLRIVNTGLENIPSIRKMHTSSILHMVDLENNKIRRVPKDSVKVRTEQFLLNYNMIEEVENHAFADAEIAKLSLKGNRQLRIIQDDAFSGLQSLRELDLSETAILKLPTNGLRELEILRLQDTDSLKKFPSMYHFEYLKVAYLTYPYHCCAFQFPATHDPDEFAKHEELVSNIHAKYCAGTGARRKRRESNETEYGRVVFSPENRTVWYDGPDWGAINRELFPHGSGEWSEDGVFHQSTVDLTPKLVQAYCGNVSRLPRNVACQPTPDAFSPCEDLMGNWTLRAAVWAVAIAALIGNFAVLLVLLSSQFRLSVPKFLMCNLALADLCMGVYLLIIAATDARSIGEYFNHAIDWQRGAGCQVAGFLTVFSSELSVYTLAVITSERWYAITHPMHVDQRLKLGTAAKVMVIGWLYAIVMATLPVLGVSSYSRTSICLPMENRDLADLLYLSFLMVFNGVAFTLICSCYCSMYMAIGGVDSAAVRSDTTIAKRMALLVFTDFACWAPITFFGMTAMAGYPLIDVTHAKILLVFFYPLNSCANPYLYALLTKQYRRDLSMLMKREVLCNRKPRRKVGSVQARNSSTGPGPCSGDQRPQRSSSSDGCPKGSPHPLRNSNTRLSLNSDHELKLKRALEFSASDSRPVISHALDSHV